MAQAPYAGPCLHAGMDLGQAWSPKYGAVWETNDEGRFVDGNRSWCSSFVGWSIYKTGLLAGTDPPIPNTENGQLLEGTGLQYWVQWFWGQGRYICGRSIGESTNRIVSWDDLGAIVLPGYLGIVSNFAHGVLFLYWTRPPMQNLDDPFNFSKAGFPGGDVKFMFNDPLNKNSNHRAWDNVAAYFDPDLRYNRFRVIHGSWGTGPVRVTNFTIVRIDDANEITRLQQYPDFISSVDPRFMIWREDHGGSDYQDGFGQTYNDALYNAKDIPDY